MIWIEDEINLDFTKGTTTVAHSEVILPEERISSIKKRIKHCKNHMEKVRLQQKLEQLYRERKRRT